MRRTWSGCGWGVGLSAALVLTACRPKGAEAPEPVVEAPVRRGSSVHRADAVAVAVASSPLQLLPDTTVAVGSVAGVSALLAVLDVEALIAKYRGYYDQTAALVAGSVGFNLLDPAQWREVGVDPDGPMGAAVLDIRSETYVGFITLTDPAKFRGFLDKLGGERRLRPVLEDRGLVLKSEPDSRTALVLRDGFAFLVSTDRPSDAPYDFSRLLATIDPARGLTATPRYQRAVASPEPPRPLTAYVDLWAIVQAEQATREGRRREIEASWEALNDEQAMHGASAEERAELRKQAEAEREWQARHEQRRQREMEMMRRWLEPASPVVFEFTADRNGIAGKIRAKMPETAPLRAVLRNAATPSPVLAALGERPVLQLGGSVDVASLIASFEELMRASGEDPEKAYAELRDTTKVDFKTELAPLLVGTGGFAMTASERLLKGELRSDTKDLGFALALAVKDVPAAQALVERLIARVPVKTGKDTKTGAHTLIVPGYRTVYVTVTAGQFVATTDVSVIRRLAGAGAPSLGLAAAVVPVMTAREVAFQGMFDVVLPMFLLRTSGNFDMGGGSLEPYGVFPGVTPEQIDKVPRSRAYKAKLRVWEGLGAKIRKEEEAQERRQTQFMVALAECIGVMAANLREQPDGVELAGGQFFGKGGLTRAFELGVDRFTTRATDRNWDLYNERSAVEEELRRIRVIDVAAALHVPTPLQ